MLALKHPTQNIAGSMKSASFIICHSDLSQLTVFYDTFENLPS